MIQTFVLVFLLCWFLCVSFKRHIHTLILLMLVPSRFVCPCFALGLAGASAVMLIADASVMAAGPTCLQWEASFEEMAAEQEDWSDLDVALCDGLETLDAVEMAMTPARLQVL